MNYGEGTIEVRMVNKSSYITIRCNFAGCIVMVFYMHSQ